MLQTTEDLQTARDDIRSNARCALSLLSFEVSAEACMAREKLSVVVAVNDTAVFQQNKVQLLKRKTFDAEILERSDK